MQEFAIFALFAETAKPVLANDRFIRAAVLECASVAFGAGAFEEEAANVEGGGVGFIESFEVHIYAETVTNEALKFESTFIAIS